MGSVVALDIASCNVGLVTVGADEINSFSDASREARVSAQFFPRLVRSRLEMFPWRFSMKQIVLSPEVNPEPKFGYQNSFLLPGDRLRAIFKSNVGLDFRVFGNKVYANVDAFSMEYQCIPPAELWTESFRTGIELEMTQYYYIALLEDEKKSAMYNTMVERQWRVAKSVDSQQQPGDAPDESQFALTAVRNTWGGGGGPF